MSASALAKIQRLSESQRGPACSVGVLLADDKLNRGQKKTLRDALAGDPNIFRATGISKWLADDCDVEITPAVIARHRRKVCHCE